MRIFYQSPVPRAWIRQRPQEIAEGLAKQGHQVFWFHAGSFQKTRLRRFDDGNGLSGLELPVLPFASACRIIEKINHYWVSWWLRHVAPDVVVVTHPVLLPWFPRRLTDCPILYDCMDVQTAFFSGRRRRRMEETERELVGRAKCIIASSEAIRDKLASSYGALPDRIAVVPNGVRLSEDSPVAPVVTSHPSIAYFGTVGSWFDRAGVTASALKHPDWSFDIFGPTDGARSDYPPNVRFHGVIPHAHVQAQARNSDILVLPFVRNELVDGVDPVKMYEYLRTGRPIVASWWPVLEKYRRFEAVRFYGGEVSLSLALEEVVGECRNCRIPMDFLAESSWQKRCHEFCRLLCKLMPADEIGDGAC